MVDHIAGVIESPTEGSIESLREEIKHLKDQLSLSFMENARMESQVDTVEVHCGIMTILQFAFKFVLTKTKLDKMCREAPPAMSDLTNENQFEVIDIVKNKFE